MAANKGDINFSFAFETQKKQLLDAKMYVENYSDLITYTTDRFLFKMPVFCAGEDDITKMGWWKLNDPENPQLYSSWVITVAPVDLSNYYNKEEIDDYINYLDENKVDTVANGTVDNIVTIANTGESQIKDSGIKIQDVEESILKSDSAVQPEDLSTVATTGSYTDLTDKPSIINNVDATEGIKASISGETLNLETEFTSELSDSLSTITVGGLTSTTLGNLKGQSLRKLIEDMVAPTQLPTYTIPTISLNITSGSLGTKEVGTSNVVSFIATGTKNDAGAYSQLRILRNGTDLVTTTSPSQVSATSVPNQFGYTDPNNPNYSYTVTYTDTFTVPLGTTNYSADGNYGVGLPKLNNKGVLDSRPFAVRSVNAPQAASTNFTTGVQSLIGAYYNFFQTGVIATNSAEVRALSGKVFNNTFQLIFTPGQNTGTFAYPATRPDISNSSVKYVEGFNSDVGDTFTKSTFQVNDAGGNPVNYKIYTVTFPAAESSVVTYNVTIP